jgi:peroxiredoxin
MDDISKLRKRLEGKKSPLQKIKQLIKKYPTASIAVGLLVIFLIIWGILAITNPFKGNNPPPVSGNQTSVNPPVNQASSPNVSGVTVSGISRSTATIYWTTDIKSTGEIDYWPTSSDNITSVSDTNLVLDHNISLTGLTPGTEYHFNVISVSEAGIRTEVKISNTFVTISVPSPEVGYAAPDFSLPDTKDNIVKLSDYKGKWLILAFWETDCQSCRGTIPHLQQYFETMPADKISVVSVNYKESNKIILISLMQNWGITFPVLLDTSGAVTDEYQVSAFPTLFFIDGNGIIQKVLTGKFNSPEEIEQALNSVQVPK